MNTIYQKFTPSWGDTIFRCRYCGRDGMLWQQVAPNQWLPYDLFAKESHRCLPPRAVVTAISRAEVIDKLLALGFEAYVPRCTSWQLVLAASNDSQTLFFMVGRLNFDFRFYREKILLELDSQGLLYTIGGEIIRNKYRDCLFNVHQRSLAVAERFLGNLPFDDLLTG